MWQILCSVSDGEINTKEEAAALLAEESREYARVLEISEETARNQLLVNLDLCTSLCLKHDADKLRELFELGKEKPDWLQNSSVPTVPRSTGATQD